MERLVVHVSGRAEIALAQEKIAQGHLHFERTIRTEKPAQQRGAVGEIALLGEDAPLQDRRGDIVGICLLCIVDGKTRGIKVTAFIIEQCLVVGRRVVVHGRLVLGPDGQQQEKNQRAGHEASAAPFP